MNSVNVYYDNRTIKRIVQASVRHSARIYGLANAIQKRLRLPVIHFRHGVPLQLLKRERKTRKKTRGTEKEEREDVSPRNRCTNSITISTYSSLITLRLITGYAYDLNNSNVIIAPRCKNHNIIINCIYAVYGIWLIKKNNIQD